MRQLQHNGLTTEEHRRLEAEIRSIARHWLDPFSAETLVRGGLGLAVHRAMALAGMTITRAVGRIDIRPILGARGSTDPAKFEDARVIL
jgi:hypothetical protein